MSEKQAELEDVEIEVDLKSSSMTAMHESMMIAEKQKSFSAVKRNSCVKSKFDVESKSH